MENIFTVSKNYPKLKEGSTIKQFLGRQNNKLHYRKIKVIRVIDNEHVAGEIVETWSVPLGPNSLPAEYVTRYEFEKALDELKAGQTLYHELCFQPWYKKLWNWFKNIFVDIYWWSRCHWFIYTGQKNFYTDEF